MNLPLWVIELSEAFWGEVGQEEPFPRKLVQPIARALPVAVVSMPMLHVSRVDEWLRNQHVIAQPTLAHDRELRACLVARAGHGIIFVDGTDCEDEQRFSVAHELAHFLRHYSHLRHRAVRRLGPEIEDVLDGKRAPREGERVQALIGGIDLSLRIHLMDRTTFGNPANTSISLAETDADRLAFELLAPFELVRKESESSSSQNAPEVVTSLLIDKYGLPPDTAAQYASIIIPAIHPSTALLRRLGLTS